MALLLIGFTLAQLIFSTKLFVSNNLAKAGLSEEALTPDWFDTANEPVAATWLAGRVQPSH
jgi:hypothetical protein